jgi:hypothetical protein
MVFRLADFDDFISIGQGCESVFYRAEQNGKKVKLTAYAGRVFWQHELESEELNQYLDKLGELRAKQVLEDVEIERIFR